MTQRKVPLIWRATLLLIFATIGIWLVVLMWGSRMDSQSCGVMKMWGVAFSAVTIQSILRDTSVYYWTRRHKQEGQ